MQCKKKNALGVFLRGAGAQHSECDTATATPRHCRMPKLKRLARASPSEQETKCAGPRVRSRAQKRPAFRQRARATAASRAARGTRFCGNPEARRRGGGKAARTGCDVYGMRARAAQQAGSQAVMTSREEADGPPLRGREKQRTPHNASRKRYRRERSR